MKEFQNELHQGNVYGEEFKTARNEKLVHEFGTMDSDFKQ